MPPAPAAFPPWLLGGHGFVDPLVGRLQIGRARLQIPHWISACSGTSGSCRPWRRHSRTKLERFIQVINAFLNVGGVLLLDYGTDLLVLRGQESSGFMPVWRVLPDAAHRSGSSRSPPPSNTARDRSDRPRKPFCKTPSPSRIFHLQIQVSDALMLLMFLGSFWSTCLYWSIACSP